MWQAGEYNLSVLFEQILSRSCSTIGKSVMLKDKIFSSPYQASNSNTEKLQTFLIFFLIYLDRAAIKILCLRPIWCKKRFPVIFIITKSRNHIVPLPFSYHSERGFSYNIFEYTCMACTWKGIKLKLSDMSVSLFCF